MRTSFSVPPICRALPAALLCAAALTATATASAQVASVYGGAVHARDIGTQRSRTFALDYTEPLGERLAWSLLYLNEGHLDGHHRDGYAAQLWVRSPRLANALTLAAGGGPYYHFDTALRTSGVEYANRHGLGWVYGVAASLELSGPWSLELKLNRVAARDRFDTHVALLGVGYRLGARTREYAPQYGESPRTREVTLFAGRTILNSFDSQRDNAFALEYRHALSAHVEWTLAWLNEGEPGLINRQGVAAQGWLVRSAFDDKLRFGVGLGPYLAHDRRHARIAHESERQIAGLVSVGARYRLTPRWHARATWHRVLADYHRDTDVLLIGAGLSF